MNAMISLANAAARRLETMFPGYFTQAKHNHYLDFGYPERVTFDLLHAMYSRNGIAKAAVEKTILKTWQTNPQLWETEEARETKLEGDIRQRFSDLRVWQRLAEADRRSLVGGYAGAILRVADDKMFREPVDGVRGGIEGLVEIIPAWAGQLTVSQWDSDERSETYGQPQMFSFQEAAVGENVQGLTRSTEIHPDRVIVWSSDGTVFGTSLLEGGYNNLIDMEKVIGGGGEGFWKNAKSAPVLEVDKDAKLKDMAAVMGVSEAGLIDAMNEQVEDWQKGFDQLLMFQGMSAKTLGVTLPSPEHFFGIALQAFAASVPIPMKILVGMQTGERASTEDAQEWSLTNMARRENVVLPSMQEFVNRLERFGMLPDRDWHFHWEDLTEASMNEKIERASKMASINSQMQNTGEFVYLPEEIRAVTDHEQLSDADRYIDGDEGDDDDEEGPDQRDDSGEREDDPKGTSERP